MIQFALGVKLMLGLQTVTLFLLFPADLEGHFPLVFLQSAHAKPTFSTGPAHGQDHLQTLHGLSNLQCASYHLQGDIWILRSG